MRGVQTRSLRTRGPPCGRGLDAPTRPPPPGPAQSEARQARTAGWEVGEGGASPLGLCPSPETREGRPRLPSAARLQPPFCTGSGRRREGSSPGAGLGPGRGGGGGRAPRAERAVTFLEGRGGKALVRRLEAARALGSPPARFDTSAGRSLWAAVSS